MCQTKLASRLGDCRHVAVGAAAAAAAVVEARSRVRPTTCNSRRELCGCLNGILLTSKTQLKRAPNRIDVEQKPATALELSGLACISWSPSLKVTRTSRKPLVDL